jgi:orotate phosphoribosyltransferase
MLGRDRALLGRVRDACWRVSLDPEGFLLKSGARSPVYFDKYGLFGDVAVLADVAEALHHRALDLGRAGLLPHLLAGVAVGAVPLVTAVALGRYLPFVIVSPEGAKGHGIHGEILGPVPPGTRRFLLVEDVLTSGGSAVAAVAALRRAAPDAEVACMAVLDRHAGGIEALAAVDVPAATLFTLEDFTGGP